MKYLFFLVLFLALTLLSLGSVAVVGATPIEFTGDLAPTITSNDILGTAWNWVEVFAVLILASMGWAYAPKITRAMRRMGR